MDAMLGVEVGRWRSKRLDGTRHLAKNVGRSVSSGNSHPCPGLGSRPRNYLSVCVCGCGCDGLPSLEISLESVELHADTPAYPKLLLDHDNWYVIWFILIRWQKRGTRMK